jgi:uncharacterized membrane protein YuzA (DUF378 family)
MSEQTSQSDKSDQTNYRRMATFVATVVASIGAMNWGCQAMGCNLVEKIMPRGAVKPTYIIIALFGLLALILAIYTYTGMYGYGSTTEKYMNPTYSMGHSNPVYNDATSSVSGGNGAYSSLAGMY